MCSGGGGGGYTIGAWHSGGHEVAGVYGASWRQVYTTGGRSGSAQEAVQT
jgi:hypothetical protein